MQREDWFRLRAAERKPTDPSEREVASVKTRGGIDRDDVTFSEKGSVVLVIDKQIYESLAHNALDVADTVDGPQLELI